ncbi:helix-turn-helix transcriptional regulator [Azospirillum sp. TSA2s]|uniref:helix-turn-helix domain-containing protein n=1 Tax=Azospirillum sp. TSA2s TaxID=709810 RepID=UPI0010AA3D9E|nr:helix-turn-helix transcriptional regulator [Azospirillum sp. TSA2s]QCG94426.1 helix-turn-helix transcriptional regulator [Azospirillum sp. TSA2s]
MARRRNGAQAKDEVVATAAVDQYVGSRIRLRRTLLGMTQTALGQAVGLTFQQIQKYEKGANRVSASRLWQFGATLDVPVSFFFDGLADQDYMPDVTLEADLCAPGEPDPMARRETLELVRAYYRIEDRALRRRLLDLIRAVAAADVPADAFLAATDA